LRAIALQPFSTCPQPRLDMQREFPDAMPAIEGVSRRLFCRNSIENFEHCRPVPGFAHERSV
jgi:hypothetical protein